MTHVGHHAMHLAGLVKQHTTVSSRAQHACSRPPFDHEHVGQRPRLFSRCWCLCSAAVHVLTAHRQAASSVCVPKLEQTLLSRCDEAW